MDQLIDISEAPYVMFRSLKVPLRSRVINYGIHSFHRSADLIDTLSPRYREWEKVAVLANDRDYLAFIASITRSTESDVVRVLNEFKADETFKEQFSEKLSALDRLNLPHADDLRFHSLSIYCFVRLLKPTLMLETGVAQGKSSTMALLAMHHNNQGKLVSIDLPNPTSELRADGTRTSTGSQEVGWLAPDYLRARWDLKLGDAKKIMPKFLDETKSRVDLFFHDSLHTYEHTKFELATVLPFMSGGVILCDNVEMETGDAFHELLESKNWVASAYRDLGGVNFGKAG